MAKSDSSPPQTDLYFNREISWLKFNQRVLSEAERLDNPLFERLRFVAISAANLDEFYSVRVAGLIGLVQDDVHKLAMTGENPAQQLASIYQETDYLMQQQQQAAATVLKALAEEGVTLLKRTQLSDAQQDYLETLFFDQFFPLLTPIAIDPIHPFPFIPHQGLSLIICLRPHKDYAHKEDLQIVIPIPAVLDRFHSLPTQQEGQHPTITIEEIILLNLKHFFPEYEPRGAGMLNILRDTDLEIEEEAEDLVREFESALQRRRRGQIIRLIMSKDTPQNLIDLVSEKIEMACDHITLIEGMIGLSSLSQMITKARPDLLFSRYQPRRTFDAEENILHTIAHQDKLVHHPYESFESVVEFIRQAANDDDVVAIKSTLYRTSHKSPIIDALIEAAENGKNVTCVVELKARFDEAANLRQAKRLKQAGVHVVYGVEGWKIHAKIILVIRREGQKLKPYMHFGTGNYHPVTAKIYTDLSLFTAHPELGQDACRLFNYMTGYVHPRRMTHLAVAPFTLKEQLLSLIDTEITHAKAGRPAFIHAKMNALVDSDMIQALYKASQAGVEIKLNIRGICCLCPQLKGLSDTIEVTSIIGRFLEHSRILCVGNGEKAGHKNNKLFISSADWMPRNLERRVEILIPILDPQLKETLLTQMMPFYFKDNQQSWRLMADGDYRKMKSKEKPLSAHQYFMGKG